MMTHILYIIMSWKTNRNIFFEKNIKSLFYWALVLTEDQAFHWKRCKEGVCWKSSYFHLHAPWILTTGCTVKSKQGALDETHLKSAKWLRQSYQWKYKNPWTARALVFSHLTICPHRLRSRRGPSTGGPASTDDFPESLTFSADLEDHLV